MFPQEQEMEENVLRHASLVSSRNKEPGNKVQKERKWPKGKEVAEKRNSIKESATKQHTMLQPARASLVLLRYLGVVQLDFPLAGS